ncbi:hypothetical protein ACTXT7_009194 [Hymenolepis weldensis]
MVIVMGDSGKEGILKPALIRSSRSVTLRTELNLLVRLAIPTILSKALQPEVSILSILLAQ